MKSGASDSHAENKKPVITFEVITGFTARKYYF